MLNNFITLVRQAETELSTYLQQDYKTCLTEIETGEISFTQNNNEILVDFGLVTVYDDYGVEECVGPIKMTITSGGNCVYNKLA